MTSTYNRNLRVVCFNIFSIDCSIERQYIKIDVEDSDTIDVYGRTFPTGIVKAWSQIKFSEEIGDGNFGKVFKGFLDMNEVARYYIIKFLIRI